MGASPSTGNGRRRASLMSPSSYQIQGKLKKHLDSYIDAPDQYIQAFISVIQTFELT
jgi:hypothetical protein